MLMFLLQVCSSGNRIKSHSFLFIPLGVFFHQLVDMMWQRPVNGDYPFFGPYQTQKHKHYFQNAIVSELTSVTEWIFFIAILVLTSLIYLNTKQQKQTVELDPLIREKTRQFYGSLLAVALFVPALSIIIIYIVDPFF